MSMFRPPSSGGGSGLTPAEYNNQTQDGDIIQAESDINGHTSWAVNSVNNSLQTLLYTQANVPSGQIQMRFAPNGQASPGWTKLGGRAIPAAFFDTVRSAVLPYSQGSSGLSSNSLAQALRVNIGDVGYFVSGLKLRAFNLGTMGWQDEAAVPQPSNMPPTSLCTVGEKLAAFGCTAGSSGVVPSLYLFDPVTRAWASGQNMPSALQGSGAADLGNGRMVTFGGKTVTASAATTATNIVDTVRIYDETQDAWTTLAQALPVRMFNVRAAPMVDGSVILAPLAVSDGTTLIAANARNVYRWTEAGGAVELDSIPAEVTPGAWLMVGRADGNLVFVPTGVPSAGARARLLDPSAPAGSQWSQLDWDYNENASHGSVPPCCPLTQTASGFALTSQTVATGISGLFATFVEAPTAGYSQVIYEYKT